MNVNTSNFSHQPVLFSAVILVFICNVFFVFSYATDLKITMNTEREMGSLRRLNQKERERGREREREVGVLEESKLEQMTHFFLMCSAPFPPSPVHSVTLMDGLFNSCVDDSQHRPGVEMRSTFTHESFPQKGFRYRAHDFQFLL